MNRRNFLLLSSLSPLFAKEFIEEQDIYLLKDEFQTLRSLNQRLRRVKSYVGYATFNYISLDETFYYARNYPKIGEFTRDEIILIEKLFYSDPENFGFYGKKTVKNITQKIDTKDMSKIPYSGHFIFKGKPLEDYHRIIKDIGSDLVLTSGIRNVVKQLSLYVNKIEATRGNISKASRSIAPPAYTYHAISDFDVGKKGWGGKNFTSAFARTSEFHKMRKLDYIELRYKINNKDGVRFEPWHVKVI